MRSSKQIEYYYKASDLENTDDLEKKQFETYNDYGYNLGSNKRRIVDYEMHAKKVKYKINSSSFNQK